MTAQHGSGEAIKHDPYCRICTGSGPVLDFHHWSYRKNVGCVLCRRCHTYLHGADIWEPVVGVSKGENTVSKQRGVKKNLKYHGLQFESWHSLMYINACLLIIDHSKFGSTRPHETYDHVEKGVITSINFRDEIPELNIPDIHTDRYIRASRFANAYVRELPSGEIGLAKAYFEVYA